MAEKAKIFISSVAQDTLTPLRNKVFRTFQEIGHDPLMFEENFGPWTAVQDPIAFCLEKVRESHIYVLLIHNKAGTFNHKAGCTVTHLEFIKAVSNDKVIMVFVEVQTKKTYFGGVRGVIFDFIEGFKAQHHREPSPAEMFEFVSAESGKRASIIPKSSEYDPYVWVFLFDIIENHQIFVENLSLGVELNWKDYASDLLRRGALLLPTSEEAAINTKLAASYGDFTDLVLDLMGRVQIKGITDWQRFFTKLRAIIYGGTIYREFGGYTSSSIGDIRNCSAVVLLKRDGNTLKVIAPEGDTDSKEGDLFYLDDESSFVSITYKHHEERAMIFFLERKQMFYLTFKAGEYVISFHFPSDGTWSQDKFKSFIDEIVSGILGTHANSLIFDFVKTLLGGMQDA
jgi:hypothetical protein